METSVRKRAIFKAINYMDSSLEKLGHHVDYILDAKKTPKQYRRGWYVNPDDAVEGINRLVKRYHPKGCRNFRHYIISFGVPDLSADTAFNIGQELADYYGKNYPVVLGVHTNIPARLHVHFLLNTINVRTGKKFSESKTHFAAYRSFINDILLKHQLPGLKELESSSKSALPRVNTSLPSDAFYDPTECHSYGANIFNLTAENEINNSQTEFVINETEAVKAYLDGVNIFYKLGVNYHGKQ